MRVVIEDSIKWYLKQNIILQVLLLIILLTILIFGIIYLVKFVPTFSIELNDIIEHITFDRITALATLAMLFRQQNKLGKIQQLTDLYSKKVKDLISEKHSERSAHDRRFKDYDAVILKLEKDMSYIKGEMEIIKNHIVK